MAKEKRSVLITGCSDGGTGAALAQEFERAGFHVYATARDTSKMGNLTAPDIEKLPLDTTSESSIAECVQKVPNLDILINNAGASYTMPIADLSLTEAKKLFDVNVWGNIATTQAFLPLLLKSPKAMIVNHTSTGADMSIPFQSTYNASKSCMSRFSDTMRIELQAFDIAVIELKTGGVKTNIMNNVQAKQPKLPEGSIYAPAREPVESALRGEWFAGMGVPPEQWAKEVVGDLLKSKPPLIVWRGESAAKAWFAGLFPHTAFDGFTKKLTGLDKVEAILRKK